MTRFARAKGSKASNERLPEEATSWAEMKRQMQQTKVDAEDAKKKAELDKVRQQNYRKFLEETEEEKRGGNGWADFSSVVSITANSSKNKTIVNKADVSNGNVKANPIDAKKLNDKPKLINNNGVKHKASEDKGDDGLPAKKKVKLNNADATGGKGVNEGKNEKKVVKKSSEQTLVENETKADGEGKADDVAKPKKKRKRNKKSKQLGETKVIEGNEEVVKKVDDGDEKKVNNNYNNNNNNAKKKKKGPKEKKEYNPYKVETDDGRSIEVGYFDTFMIKKEDVARLKELRKKMMAKGIPKSEINAALKLERRRAEKALTRERKKVCLNCRKGGHSLSDCPQLNDSSMEAIPTGICYKCGSTEHTHFECKVVRNPNDFKFATCFICKEQGHISRQCPDNARGLYPKGGACKLCGDVTHLKKDCPTHVAKQEQDNIVLDTIGGDGGRNLEALDDKWRPHRNFKPKAKKIVRFRK